MPKKRVKTTGKTGLPVMAQAIQEPEAVPAGVMDRPEKAKEIKAVAETAAKIKVVLAVKSPHDQDTINRLLGKNDFSTWMCKDGDEVLNLLYSEDPDLLIWDISLPKIDGLKSYKRLYDSQRKQVPVISLTNEPDVLTEIENTIGIDVQIKKPINSVTLMEGIKKALSEHGTRGKWTVRNRDGVH